MTTTMTRTKETVQLWRRQVGQRARLADRNGPRPLAVLSYLVRGPIAEDRHVELRQLTLVALFDERSVDGELITRLVGVGGEIDELGLRFGGPDLCRFDKNLREPPVRNGTGSRFDAADGELLAYALHLECYLQRAARHPYVPRKRVPPLPILSAGSGNGGHRARIDLGTLRKRQIITVGSPTRDLVGRSGATEFDFYQTRFHVAR